MSQPPTTPARQIHAPFDFVQNSVTSMRADARALATSAGAARWRHKSTTYPMAGGMSRIR